MSILESMKASALEYAAYRRAIGQGIISSGQVRSNLMTSPRAGANQNFESEEHTCQRFVSRDLVFRWTVLAQG
jgi:hypothetical protein